MAEEIAALRVTLGMDTIDFSSGMKNVNARLSALNSEFRAITSGAGKFDNSLDGLRKQSDVLSRTLDVHGKKVEELKRKYEESKEAKGEDAIETLRLQGAYNNALATMRNVEQRLQAVNDRIEEQVNPWKRASKAMDEYGQKMQDTGGKITEVGKGLTAGVSAPIAGIGVALGKMASDFDSATGNLKAKLGITTEQSKELGKVAENVWKDNFGENIAEVSDTIATVSQQIQELSNDDLKSASESAYTLSQVFDADISESSKTAASLMRNFGIDSTKAFDIITTGFQKGGDYSGELLDTLNEYSVQFASMGLSADQFLSILISGAQNGAFNLDKVGDAVKEFNIRAQDGSKTTADGFAAIGLNAQQMGEAIAKGGDDGQKAFVATISALAAMKDPLKQNVAGTELFGTQWEDVRKKVIFAMSDATKNIQTVDGATKKAGDALQDNFGAKLQKMWRDTQADFKPLGDDLLKIAKDTLPKIASAVDGVTSAFADMSPKTRDVVLGIAGIAAAAGPVAMGIGGITSAAGLALKALSPIVATIGAEGLAGSLTALAGPIGLTVAGIGLVAGAGYALKKSMDESKQANLDHAQSLVDQQQSLEGLTAKYEALREKNNLSNYELLRFRDIQSELKTAKSAEEITKLKDEADKLREKSGLSNDQLGEMLSLNDQLIDKVPKAGQAFSDQGNKVLTNADDLHQANNKLRENIQLELEIQKTKAEAKLDQNIRNQISATDELNAKIVSLNNAKIEAAAKEYQLGQMKAQQQKAYHDGQKAIGDGMEIDIQRLQQEVHFQNQNVDSVASQVQEKQKSLGKTTQEIEKTQALFDKMVNIQLAQAGINGKGQEGISLLDQTIQKTVSRKAELIRIRDQQGGLDDQQQKELTNLDQSLDKYRTAKKSINDIQGEQTTVNEKIKDGTNKAGKMNEVLSESEVKDIKFTGDGYNEAKIISDEAGRSRKKEIDVTDYGKTHMIDAEANKNASKTITIGAVISSAFRTAVKAFEYMSTIDIPGFAVGTNYAPGGWAMVGEQGPELMYVPRGAQIKTASETRNVLSSNSSAAVQADSTTRQPIIIQSVLNGKVIAEETYSDISKLIKASNKLGARGRGVIMT